MILQESCLYPPAYALGREAVKECEIGGFRVPAGWQVFMFQWVATRPTLLSEAEPVLPGTLDRKSLVAVASMPTFLLAAARELVLGTILR